MPPICKQHTFSILTLKRKDKYAECKKIFQKPKSRLGAVLQKHITIRQLYSASIADMNATHGEVNAERPFGLLTLQWASTRFLSIEEH